jgi:hypothetical protein
MKVIEETLRLTAIFIILLMGVFGIAALITGVNTSTGSEIEPL